MGCICHAIPLQVLDRLSADPTISDSSRTAFRHATRVDPLTRSMRLQATRLARVAGPAAATVQRAAGPTILVFDCNNSMILPGPRIGSPHTSADRAARRAFEETEAVADFYKRVFARNSIDGGGASLLSSIHYGAAHPNSGWDGRQAFYGDGDGEVVLDFTLSADMIAHELTHGVTQHTLRVGLRNEPGAINESLSDVFGSMFRQWRADQTVAQADWLIGADLIAPPARRRGTTCLRDMARPDAVHCLAPQVSRYGQYRPGMEAHISSGILNRAFHLAAMAMGGRSWERAGPIWYRAMTGGPRPNLNIRGFAALTRSAAAAIHGAGSAEAAAVAESWSAVGL